MLLLHMNDEFSGYSVISVVESKKLVIIMENIVIGWFMRFATAVKILHDLGGGGDFNNDLILLNCYLCQPLYASC